MHFGNMKAHPPFLRCLSPAQREDIITIGTTERCAFMAGKDHAKLFWVLERYEKGEQR